MRLYLAGPDVFRRDALAWADDARRLCAEFGHEALTPLDNDEPTADQIYQSNVELIGRADCVVANLNPFRGEEPDSGTCVEVGMALAMGKRVVGYLANRDSLVERLTRTGLVRSGAPCARPEDIHGNAIEDFGLPLNLMLAVPATIVFGGLREAIAALTDAHHEEAEEIRDKTEADRQKLLERPGRYLPL